MWSKFFWFHFPKCNFVSLPKLGIRWLNWCWPSCICPAPSDLASGHVTSWPIQSSSQFKSPVSTESPLVTCLLQRGSLPAYIGIFFPLPQCMRGGLLKSFFSQCVGPRFVPQCMDLFSLSVCQQGSFLATFRAKRRKFIWHFSVWIHHCVEDSILYFWPLVLT